MTIPPNTIAIIFWHMGIGGIARRLNDICCHLLATSNLSIVVLLKGKTKDDIALPESPRLTVSYFDQEAKKGRQIEFFFWLVTKLLSLKSKYLLTFSVRFSMVGAVYKMLSTAMRLKPKFVISEEIHLSNYLMEYEAWYWRHIVKYCYKLADQVIVLSKTIKMDLVNCFGVSDKKIEIINSWMMVNQISHQKRQYDFIFVGRLAKEKGLESIINLAYQAKKQNIRIKICVVGDGDLRSEFLAQVKKYKLGEYIETKGYVANPQKLVGKAKALILPSRNEGVPLVILEAAAIGVSAIITPFKGAHESVVNYKTGVISPRPQFVETCLKLITTAYVLDKLGKSAYDHVQQKFNMGNLEAFCRAFKS